MTVEEIVAEITAAGPGKALDRAEELLDAYEGEDKELIEPAIMSTATLIHSEGMEIELPADL